MNPSNSRAPLIITTDPVSTYTHRHRFYPKDESRLLLCTDVVREQAEVAIWRDEGEDPFRLPALETNARMEADVIQQPRVLQSPGKKARRWIKHYAFRKSNGDAVFIKTHAHKHRNSVPDSNIQT